jgi:hypothetical protein
MMRIACETPALLNVNIAANTIATGIFAFGAFNDVSTLHAAAAHGYRQKVRGPDSESRILAIKIFSRLPASRLITARQNWISARIASTDSAMRFPGRALPRGRSWLTNDEGLARARCRATRREALHRETIRCRACS